MTQKTVTRTTNDVAQRLRDWRSVHLTRVGVLCDDAAKEIDRLQKVIDDYVCIAAASAREIKHLRQSYGQTNEKRCDSDTSGAALTDAERASVTRAIETLEGVEYIDAFSAENDATAAATLRGLLERLK